MTKLKNLICPGGKMNPIVLWIILGAHIIANLACWLRWLLATKKQNALKWFIFGFLAGWIPTWPDSMIACWVLTIIFVVADAVWVVFNFRAAEDYCLDKTIHYHTVEELMRYSPDSE